MQIGGDGRFRCHHYGKDRRKESSECVEMFYLTDRCDDRHARWGYTVCKPEREEEKTKLEQQQRDVKHSLEDEFGWVTSRAHLFSCASRQSFKT